jgi:phosphatidylserine synthase
MREAYLMMIGAATFDKLDGALARRLGLTEPLPDDAPKKKINMGSILDDLADAISFCIVPAWIFYIAMSQFGDGRFVHLPIGWVAVFYALTGMGRLVYFTLDKTPIPGFFKGLPTPAAAMLVLSPMVIFDHSLAMSSQQIGFWAMFAMGTMIFAGVIMNVYPIRYIHLGRTFSRHPWFGRLNLLLLTISIFTPIFGQLCLGYMILYLLSPLFTWRIHPEDAARETRHKTVTDS